MEGRSRFMPWHRLAFALVIAAMPTVAFAQGGGMGGVGGSAVGYVEDAIPGSYFRIRFDAAYVSNRSNRAEFFYAIGQRIGPGVPHPEIKNDYQEASLYFEKLLCEGFSGFIDVPFRFLNPEINDNAAGLSDIALGGKKVLTECDSGLLSGMFRVVFPTGASTRGLGTHHYSLEGGLLGFKRCSDRIALEGELRYWLPIQGTEGYEGSVVRYGMGVQYRAIEGADWAIVP